MKMVNGSRLLALSLRQWCYPFLGTSENRCDICDRHNCVSNQRSHFRPDFKEAFPLQMSLTAGRTNYFFIPIRHRGTVDVLSSACK